MGILIPTRNRRLFLKPALESALGQTQDSVRILVIDNGSDPWTRDYMASIRDNRVTYIANEHDIGLGGSINKGIDRFPGDVDWVTVLCDDDLLAPDFVEAMLRAVGDRRAKTIVRSRLIFIQPDGKIIREALDSPMEESGLDYVRNRSRNLRETYLTGILFNRKAFQEIGGYPEFPSGVGTDDALVFALSIKDRLVYQQAAHAFITIHPEAESQEYRNFPLVYQSIRELRDYCVQRYYLDPPTGKILPGDLQKLMSRYIRRILSNICLGKLWKEGLARPERREMFDTVSDHPEDFSLRVRAGIYMMEKHGISIERLLPYRGFWGIAEFIQKKMP